MVDDAVSVVKTTVESYTVRVEQRGWAVVTVDEQTGILQIHSDFGDWAHHWNRPGKRFKAFLLELDDGYLMGKLATRNWFDSEQTIRGMRKEIVRFRRGGYVDRDTAREAWDDLDGFDTSSVDTFYHSFNSSSVFGQIFEDSGCVDVTTDFPPGLRGFMRHLWPQFIACIRKELQASPVEYDALRPLILQIGELAP